MREITLIEVIDGEAVSTVLLECSDDGRTGRLLLNLILVRSGFVVMKQQRPAYLAALDRADEGDPGLLAELLARAMLDNLNRFILPNVAGPARLIPLPALADEQFSLPALRQAARRGRLEAFQQPDGTWLSSRAAIDQYAQDRGRRQATGA